MIQTYRGGQWREETSLFTALGLNREHREILSLTGAGGKTTVIRRLQQEYQKMGIFHAVSTTTHMQYEKNESFLGEPVLESFLDIYHRSGTVWMGEPVSEKKMKGFPVDFLDKVKECGAWLLLEADGAKKLPVKAPEEWEPVIWSETTMVIHVFGLDGIGKPIKEVCFRKERAARLLHKKETDLCEPEDLVLLGSSTKSGKKQVGERAYHIILNKADHDGEQQMAKEIGRMLMQNGISHVHITSGLLSDTGRGNHGT